MLLDAVIAMLASAGLVLLGGLLLLWWLRPFGRYGEKALLAVRLQGTEDAESLRLLSLGLLFLPKKLKIVLLAGERQRGRLLCELLGRPGLDGTEVLEPADIEMWMRNMTDQSD